MGQISDEEEFAELSATSGRSFPKRFRYLAQALGIHPELSRHLDVGMREAMPLARVDPNLKPFGDPLSSHLTYAPPAQQRYASIHSAPGGGGVGSGSSRIAIA